MGGTWEFAGVLFALSGFLLVGGPALLGSFDEQTRGLVARRGGQPRRPTPITGYLDRRSRLLLRRRSRRSGVFLLWRRRLTSVYNVDARALFTALEQTLRPGPTLRRIGDSFLIGGARARQRPAARRFKRPNPPRPGQPLPTSRPRPEHTLHVDAFPVMRHVTLRWEPADSPVRREVEQELAPPGGGSAPRAGSHPRRLPFAGRRGPVRLALVGRRFVLLHHLFPRYPPCSGPSPRASRSAAGSPRAADSGVHRPAARRPSRADPADGVDVRPRSAGRAGPAAAAGRAQRRSFGRAAPRRRRSFLGGDDADGHVLVGLEQPAVGQAELGDDAYLVVVRPDLPGEDEDVAGAEKAGAPRAAQLRRRIFARWKEIVSGRPA